jgi:hypothetical protein
MNTYKLITINPLKFYNKSLGGLPVTLKTNSPPETPTGYAYVQDIEKPTDAPEGFRYVRELTTEAYGWVQQEIPPAPPEPNPE